MKLPSIKPEGVVESLDPRSGVYLVYFATQASSGMGVGMHRNIVAERRLVGCSI